MMMNDRTSIAVQDGLVVVLVIEEQIFILVGMQYNSWDYLDMAITSS
jgi:hypothetical protein